MKQLLLLSAFFIFISCNDDGNSRNKMNQNELGDGAVGQPNTGGNGVTLPGNGVTLPQHSYFHFNDSIVFQNKEVNYYFSGDGSYAVAECGNLLLFINRQNEFIKIYRDRSKEAGKDEGEWWVENNQIKLSPPKPNKYVFPDVHVNPNESNGTGGLDAAPGGGIDPAPGGDPDGGIGY